MNGIRQHRMLVPQKAAVGSWDAHRLEIDAEGLASVDLPNQGTSGQPSLAKKVPLAAAPVIGPLQLFDFRGILSNTRSRRIARTSRRCPTPI